MLIAIKQLLPCVLIMFLLLSCKKLENRVEDETYKVVSMLVNSYAIPVLPPPPITPSTNKLDEKFDALKKITNFKNEDINIYLNYLTIQVEGENIEINNQKTYKIIDIKDSNFIMKSLDTSKIKVRKNIKFHNQDMTDPVDFNRVDMVLSFSKINFSPLLDKAVLVIGVSRGNLSGFTSIILCEKINDKWIVTEDRMLSIS